MLSDDLIHYTLVPAEEIEQRLSRLQQQLAALSADGALILDPVNMYYFTGTMQQGVLFIPAGGEPVFLVRRSLERAQLESPLSRVLLLKGFSELPTLLANLGFCPRILGLAEVCLSVAVHKNLAKAFSQVQFTDISPLLSRIRAVKSAYEVECIRRAGLLHEQVYAAIPAMLREGMSEWELGTAIQQEMMLRGYAGITRFTAASMEIFTGIVSFGESGNYPTASIGPGGMTGLSPAFPVVGGSRRLQRGEPIFLDTGFGFAGYFTDKTRVFSLGPLPAAAVEAHHVCLEIQEAVRCRLKPGAIPAEICAEIEASIVGPRRFGRGFMGFGSNHVPFLGHGIGLAIDEFPVLAEKNQSPLEANMVIALEPKKGLDGIGLVGVENTFLVTEAGGEKLTPGPDAITVV